LIGSGAAHNGGWNSAWRAPRLQDQHIHLSQLGNDLLTLVSLSRHIDPPSCQMTYFRSDHFNEDRSTESIEFGSEHSCSPTVRGMAIDGVEARVASSMAKPLAAAPAFSIEGGARRSNQSINFAASIQQAVESSIHFRY